jgi:hypothetical protein
MSETFAANHCAAIRAANNKAANSIQIASIPQDLLGSTKA